VCSECPCAERERRHGPSGRGQPWSAEAVYDFCVERLQPPTLLDNTQTDTYTDIQTDRQTDRQAGRRLGSHTPAIKL